MFKAQAFVIATAVILTGVGFFLVSENQNSLGAISLSTYLGVIAMAVVMQLSSALLKGPKQSVDGKEYGHVMGWAMLFFVWPSYVTPLLVLPTVVGKTSLVMGLFVTGILLFVGISLFALKVSFDRMQGKRRYAKWLYFIPSFLYVVPALVIGYFVVGAFTSNLTTLRIAHYGSLLLGGVFSYFVIRIALFDLFPYEKRKYSIFDLFPLGSVIVGVVVLSEILLPLFQGQTQQMYLLFTLSLYALVCAQILGVLSVSRRAKF